jgi:CRP/FNR family transcriptional regulator, anaerobic regulatory protein
MRSRFPQALHIECFPRNPWSSNVNNSTAVHGIRPHGNVSLFAPPKAVAAERSTLAELLRLMGVDDAGARMASGMTLPTRRLYAGDTLFHEGSRAESIYFVRSGTFKIFHTAEDGYEQVLGFVGRAEVLGFDALCTEGHPTEAVALEDANVYVLLVRDLLTLAERCPELGRVLHLAVSNALTRQGELADVMSAVAAEVRLARFLMHLSHRMAACGQSPRRFVLRMSRRDIASNLGVAHETVSRSFTALAGWGLVVVENREVEIIDMDGLRSFAKSTRRQIDEAGRPCLPHLHGARQGLEQRVS